MLPSSKLPRFRMSLAIDTSHQPAFSSIVLPLRNPDEYPLCLSPSMASANTSRCLVMKSMF